MAASAVGKARKGWEGGDRNDRREGGREGATTTSITDGVGVHSSLPPYFLSGKKKKGEWRLRFSPGVLRACWWQYGVLGLRSTAEAASGTHPRLPTHIPPHAPEGAEEAFKRECTPKNRTFKGQVRPRVEQRAAEGPKIDPLARACAQRSAGSLLNHRVRELICFLLNGGSGKEKRKNHCQVARAAAIKMAFPAHLSTAAGV